MKKSKKSKSKKLVVLSPTIPNVVDKKQVPKAIIPKPTRSEIIEALVLKKHQEWMEQVTAFAAKGREISDAFEKAVKEFLAANPKLFLDNIRITHTYDNAIALNSSVKFSALPKEVDNALRKYLEWEATKRNNQPRAFDHKTVREQMRMAIKCDPARVNALAASPQIAETLAYIEKNKPKPLLTLDVKVQVAARQ